MLICSVSLDNCWKQTTFSNLSMSALVGVFCYVITNTISACSVHCGMYSLLTDLVIYIHALYLCITNINKYMPNTKTFRKLNEQLQLFHYFSLNKKSLVEFIKGLFNCKLIDLTVFE